MIQRSDWYQSDPNQDPRQIRQRKGLGIAELLEQRECWRFQESLNVEIYPAAEHSSTAPNLIFLPGIGTYVELYAELLTQLQSRGFNVIAVDPPGHGFSAGLAGQYQVIPFCQQLSQIIDRVSTRFTGRWGVYGYSIGALVAVALAERDPRIESVICGTLLFTEFPPDMMHAWGWSATSMSALWFPTLRLPLRNFIDFEQLLGQHPAGKLINQDQRIVFDYPLSTLANLFTHRCGIVDNRYPFRLTLIQGDRDEILSLEYARESRDRIQQPMALVVVPNAGHMLPWDDPEGLAKLVADNF